MAEELKSCPFCGPEPDDAYPHAYNEWPAYPSVCCQRCGVKLGEKHWNTRPIEDSLREQLAEEKRRGEAFREIALWQFLASEPKPINDADKKRAMDWIYAEAQRILSGQKSSPTTGKTGGEGL